MSDYYDVSLKHAREELLRSHKHFCILHERVETPNFLMSLFEQEKPEVVIHLAAQAGVRYSIESPRSYLESNIVGTFEVLEAARAYPPQHLLMASTSSAYGASTDMPYRETTKADHPMSFYAATKKSTEVIAHSYAHIYGVPITMFRFFTVYGPWGRPDMALFKFTKAILAGDSIDVFNFGRMRRDFTYVDDLTYAISLLIDKAPRDSGVEKPLEGDSLSPVAPFRVVNIGNSESVELTEFIRAAENAIGKTVDWNLMPMQQGDVPATWADASLLYQLTGYKPSTPVSDGVHRFVEWYREFYKC